MAEIYLIRHGLAASRGKAWPDDSKRPLTHKGKAKMREVAHGLKALDVKLDLVLTSPLVRAQQSASRQRQARPSQVPGSGQAARGNRPSSGPRSASV